MIDDLEKQSEFLEDYRRNNDDVSSKEELETTLRLEPLVFCISRDNNGNNSRNTETNIGMEPTGSNIDIKYELGSEIRSTDLQYLNVENEKFHHYKEADGDLNTICVPMYSEYLSDSGREITSDQESKYLSEIPLFHLKQLGQIENLNINLKEHAEDKKMKFTSFNCSQCGYSSNQKSNLQRHVEALHYNNRRHKNWKCKNCEFSTDKPYRLKRHQESVHEKMKHYNCKKCQYSSYQKSEMDRHCKAVHSGVKEYKCDKCGYQCSRRGYLVTHMNAVHYNIKNYRCEKCAFATSRRNRLLEHKKTIHEKTKNDE